MPNVNFNDVALTVMFDQKINTTSKLIEQYGLQYRSGKTAVDVKKCIEKSFKNGHGRTESELSFLELYLSQTFKKTSTLNQIS
tara:strand:+ start:3326 stop:3574 length:249 start_codon:yes stop_codon:yes gene_type:complete